MDVFARFVERLTSERHPVLPAHEPTDARQAGIGRNVDGSHTVTVARPPDESLGVRRDELAMVVEERPVGPEGEKCVEERTVAWSTLDALGDTNDHRDTVAAGYRGELAPRRTVDDDALLGHTAEDRLDGGVVPECRVATNVEPCGVAGQPGLGEGYERRTGAGSVGGPSVGEGETMLEVRRDFVLDDRDAYR